MMVLVFHLIVTGNVAAATLSVPSKYTTIQSAIDAAIDGDTVLVSPGTYIENIDFKGKKITVHSTIPTKPELTIIDGSSKTGVSVVTFASGENPNTVLEGFTIMNGKATANSQVGAHGGGIRIRGEVSSYPSNPTLKNLIIENNEALYGGGISCVNNTTITIGNNPITMENVTIRGNKATYYGGGMFSHLCPFNYKNSEVFANSAKDGAGVYVKYGSGYYGGFNVFDNVKIENNIASENGGGLRFHSTYNPDHIKVILKDVTLQCNEAKLGSAIHCDPEPNEGGHPGYTYVTENVNTTINVKSILNNEIHTHTQCSGMPKQSDVTVVPSLKCTPETKPDPEMPGSACLTGGKGTGKPFSWMVKDEFQNIITQNLNTSMSVGQNSQSMASLLATQIGLGASADGNCIVLGNYQLFVGAANTTPDCLVTSQGCQFNPLAKWVSQKQMLSSIRGFVWNDLNASRLQENNEDYLANWIVTLKYPDGKETTAITGADGYYEFTGLSAGSYAVAIQTKPLASYTTAQSFIRQIDLTTIPRTVNFGIKVEKANLTVTATGNGTVTSSLGGISCGADCQEDYAFNAETVLTATPTTGFIFVEWTGDCNGTGECRLLMNQDRKVNAIFKEMDKSTCINPAPYDTATSIITIQKLDVPLLSPLDGFPTSEIAIFEAKLQQVPGISDFRILPESLKYLSSSTALNPNNARFEWNESMFSNGGKLSMCVAVPSVVVINGMKIPSGTKNYQVTLRTLAVDQGIFHIEKITPAN